MRRRSQIRDWIIVGTALLIFSLALLAMGRDLIIKHWGHEVIVTVTKLPVRCSKHSMMVVSLNNQTFDLGISRRSCYAGTYQLGQKLTVLKHDSFNAVIWPSATPGFVMLGMIGFLVIAIFFLKKQYAAQQAKMAHPKPRRK